MRRPCPARSARGRPSQVVHNGLWPEEHAPVARIRDAADLLFIGELRWLKGVDVLLEAIARAMPRPALRAAIVGVHRPDEACFRRQARRRDRSSCHLSRPPARAPGPYSAAGFFVLPSRAESFPYVMLEAMAAARPIIASRTGGIPRSSLRQTAWCRPGMRRHCWPPSRPSFAILPPPRRKRGREHAPWPAASMPAAWPKRSPGSMPRRWRTAAPRPDLFRNETAPGRPESCCRCPERYQPGTAPMPLHHHLTIASLPQRQPETAPKPPPGKPRLAAVPPSTEPVRAPLIARSVITGVGSARREPGDPRARHAF